MNILKLFFINIFFLVFLSGCGLFQTVKELKNNVLGSLHYNENKELNSLQLEQQLLLYKNSFSHGRIASLSDAMFDPSYGQTGLWIPMKFIKNIGGGVYFIDEFNPKKPLVVFVHGAGGNPREWNDFINTFKKYYQVVVVSYPSGMRLSHSAQVIGEALSFLIEKYHLNYMPIIAHSMGGLVMKQVIDDMSEPEQRIVKNFITIATPWGGDNLAKNATKIDYGLPYWVDMKPNSEFLKKLHQKDFPETINHFLIFGYDGKLTLTAGTSNDGVIPLSSQLYFPRQKNATKVIGYDETHTSILKSEKLIGDIYQILTP